MQFDSTECISLQISAACRPNLGIAESRVPFARIVWKTGPILATRTRYDLQHFRNCGLTFQQFRSLFVEQPHVLNRDHGLGGEVLHQFDLLISKRSYLLAVDDDGPSQFGVLEHGHGNMRLRARKPGRRA